MSSFISQYTDLLIKQYWEKPKAMAEISLQIGMWNDIFTWFKAFETGFDIDEATNQRLDIIGRIVGVNRHVPYAIQKTFFGFNGDADMTGFDDPSDPQPNLGPFYLASQSKYTNYELNDHQLWFFIKSKIKKNVAHGVMTSTAYQSIQDAIITLFEGQAYVEDNMDMTMTLHISPREDAKMIKVIMTLDLLPKTQGVRYILVQSDPYYTFGFSNNPNSKGFANRSTSTTSLVRFLQKLI